MRIESFSKLPLFIVLSFGSRCIKTPPRREPVDKAIKSGSIFFKVLSLKDKNITPENAVSETRKTAKKIYKIVFSNIF